MRKEIVDNETDGYRMADFLNEAITEESSTVDIATGYFNASGFNLVRSSLEKALISSNFHLRLLFGRDAIKRESSSAEMISSQGDNSEALSDELTSSPITPEAAKTIDRLIAFLKNRQKVEVRRNPRRFNHAKCYIFGNSVALGSSNFTSGGLTGNMELNAILYQPSAQREVRNWFERRWEEAEDASDYLINILEESKFGLPLEPFLAYLKFLYEYYKPKIAEIQEGEQRRNELATFQNDAVKTALRIMRKYSGVIIADSTGLGKTHIGLEMLRELVSVHRMRALLLAPKQVIDTVWEPRLDAESIKTKNISIEITGNSNFEPERYVDYDVVLIDESHNYRNPSTNRRMNLMKLLSGGKRKQVILLTATPVNNSLMDLYHQISLITAGDDSHFIDLDIRDLRHHFLSADRKNLLLGVEDIIRLLDEIMVRRTRQFIRENYPNATINGKPVTFPKRRLKKAEYSLTQIFGTTIYKHVLDTIDELNLVPYRVQTYVKKADEEERQIAQYRADLQKYGLLKRFESSVASIRESIGRLIKFYEFFEKAINEGMILDSKAFNRILSDMQDGEDNDEDVFSEVMRSTLRKLTPEYDVKSMKRDLEHDFKLLRPIYKSLSNVHPYSDGKLIRLKELFDEEKVFETGGRKVVIFTQFVDTARYLFNDIRETVKDHTVRLLTGETDPETRRRTIEAFAPKANNAANVTENVDILISTDVLSEGQNLQDSSYCINYDLPWNPMKIVQRVGRIDRLMSIYDEVTAAIFLPEKELEDLLGLLGKLESKIRKVSTVVGVESTILGEKENPRNFNALERIKKEDGTLLDEMERSSELLPSSTPLQFILAYLKQVGEQKLEAIKLGRRSGKASDVSGMVLFYREKRNPEGLHLLFYNYETGKLERVNDIAWIFQKIRCGENEKLHIPLSGLEAFEHFHAVDGNARSLIVRDINSPVEASEGQKMKPKNQRALAEKLFQLYNDGQLPRDKTLPVYEILQRHNLAAWEEDFAAMMEDYEQSKNADALLMSVDTLFNRYRIENRETASRKELSMEDLEIIGYIFLSEPGSLLHLI